MHSFTNTPLADAILIVVAFLFGLYEIGYGFYAWRLNGFKFYISAGILIGTPFLVVGVILFLMPACACSAGASGLSFQSWEALILLVWVFGVAWKAWRKRIAKRDHPAQWEKWEAILHGE